MKAPYQFNRRILLAIIGMTPQIVTETLYKLCIETDPAFVPTEIHLITTHDGANQANLALLGVEGEGEFYQFCSDYGLSGITFDEKHIHIITDTEGLFISDDQSTEHNKMAADFITDKVREFTLDDDSAIHLSLAGGRKTMSFYAGYALSLYGRMQDRLSHVLVNTHFQNNTKFFYPRPKPKRIDINNTYYSTDDANIILSDIPYVRMRYHIPNALLSGQAGFQETVEIIQRFAQPETIIIDIPKREVRLNGMPIQMSDADRATYLWMCQRKKSGEPPLILDEDAFMFEYLENYDLIVTDASKMYKRTRKVAMGKDVPEQKEWFMQRKSKVKGRIEAALGAHTAKPFLIQTVDRKGGAAYEIGVPADAITIKYVAET